MTRSLHIDDEALVALAAHDDADLDVGSHLDRCARCAEELRQWQRIADAVQATIRSVPPPHAGVAERIFGEIDRSPPAREADRSVRSDHRVDRPWRWLIPVPILMSALAIILVVGFGSTAPSSAMVLSTIHRVPVLAAQLHQVEDWTEADVLRAPQGYVAIEYRSQGTTDRDTGAFEYVVKTVEPGGPRLGSATYASDGTTVYLPCNAQWREIGKKPCIAYPVQPGGAPAPSALAILKAAEGPVGQLGSRDIDGGQTTGYRVTVPVSALVQSAMPSLRSLVQYGNESTVSDVRVSVWIDSRGLAREVDEAWVQRQTDLPALLHASSVSRLRYGRGPFHPATPKRNDVTVAPNAQSAWFLVALYDNELTALRDSLTPSGKIQSELIRPILSGNSLNGRVER